MASGRQESRATGAGAFGKEWSATLRRGSETELRRWLDLALDWVGEADEIAMTHFRRDLEISAKPDRTLVTQADQAIERRIREQIQHAFPDHGIVGEEYGTEGGGAPVRWYVDPIDGTHNFVRGVPLFGTLLAVERDGERQIGIMSAPALRERWFGLRGGGAWARRLDDTSSRRLTVSAVASIEDAQLLYGSSSSIEKSGRAPGFRSLQSAVWRERGFGDFWGYALVAEGAGGGDGRDRRPPLGHRRPGSRRRGGGRSPDRPVGPAPARQPRRPGVQRDPPR